MRFVVTGTLERDRMRRWASDTWRSVVAMVDPATGLAADHIGESLAASDRSATPRPTNIGLPLVHGRRP